MSIAQDREHGLIAVEYRWVSALAIPILVNLFVIISIFAGFTGEQATEVGKRIYEVETQLPEALRRAVGAAPLDAASLDILLKVGLFSVLLVTWCVTSTIITIALFRRLLGPTSRFIVATFVAYSVPLVLTAKYVYSNQHFIGPSEQGNSIFWKFASVLWNEEYVPIWWHVGKSPLLIASTITTIAIVQLLLLNARPRSRGSTTAPTWDYAIPVLSVVAIAIFISFSAFLAFEAPHFPVAVGSTNLLFFFVVLLFPFLAGLRWLTLKLPRWATLLLLVTAIGFNLTADHSNNPVNKGQDGKREKVASAEPKNDACTLRDGSRANNSFECWFDHRKDKAEFAGRPYPVYVVAAAGGGAYAAIHTQLFLEYMREHCPIFAHHIFAISGVSGGGIGALAYAGRLAADSSSRNPFPQGSQRCLSDFESRSAPISDSVAKKVPAFDYISPIIGGGLFTELLQRVLPVHIKEFDRTHILQRSLDHQWSATSGNSKDSGCPAEKIFSTDCRSSTYWTGKDDVPALIFNATSVVAGTPVILSHMGPLLDSGLQTEVRNSFVAQNSFSLIDAALASASFPIALPAPYIIDQFNIPQRVTDGAYFDNTGLPSAYGVKNSIENIIRSSNSRKFLRQSNPEVADLLEQDGSGQKTSFYDFGQEIQVRVILLDRSDELLISTVSPGKNASEYDYLRDQCKTVSLTEQLLRSKGTEIVAHVHALFSARDRRSIYVRHHLIYGGQIALARAASSQNAGSGLQSFVSPVMWESEYSVWAKAKSTKHWQSDEQIRNDTLAACNEPKFPIIFNYSDRTRHALQERLIAEYGNRDLNGPAISEIIQELQPACGEGGCQNERAASTAQQ